MTQQLLQHIDWIKSESNHNTTKDRPSNKYVVCVCPICNAPFDIIYKEIRRRKYDMCQQCAFSSKEFGASISKATKGTYTPERIVKLKKHGKKMWVENKEILDQKRIELWQNQDFRSKKAEECKVRNKKLWENRDAMIQKIKDTFTPDRLARASEISRQLWNDDDYKSKTMAAINDPDNIAKISESSRSNWQDDKYKSIMATVRANQSRKTSSIQKILYNILDNLGVVYYGETNGITNPKCIIGPYCFDCVVPRSDKPDLLIECQGDYWHSKPKVIIKDKQKATYIMNNFAGIYELKEIWEHEFGTPNRIHELIKYWLGITKHQLIPIDFSNIKIKECTKQECYDILQAYHYLHDTDRARYKIGAYYGDELIAVCTFSRLIRQNIHQSLQCAYEEVLELSRLCIKPQYQHKNLASWFISRCIKFVSKDIKKIVAYCDTTFNHNGTIYKASNFKQDKIVKADYWYVNASGWAMHKKTLYNKAVKMSMTEAQYADKFGYTKVYGKNKLRFVYEY